MRKSKFFKFSNSLFILSILVSFIGIGTVFLNPTQSVVAATQNTVISTSSLTVDKSDWTYWRDFIATGINAGARINTIKATTVSYPLFRGSFGDNASIVGYSNNLVGTFYLVKKQETVKLSNGTQIIADYISNDGINWEWIDSSALSRGESGIYTAYASLAGTGANGAIKWYVSPSDPLASEIKSAIAQWNRWIPGTFAATSSSSPTDVNINFKEGNLQARLNPTNNPQNDYTYIWATTKMGWYTHNDGSVYSQHVIIDLNTGGSPNELNLLSYKSTDDMRIITVVEHELGHALGLGHSGHSGDSWSYSGSTNLMYNGSTGPSSGLTISQQQINALKFIRNTLKWTYTGNYFNGYY